MRYPPTLSHERKATDDANEATDAINPLDIERVTLLRKLLVSN